MRRASLWTAALGMFGLVSAAPAAAQDMMRHIDRTSPEMTSAEMTRADVEAVIAAATPAQRPDFTGKKLSGLDLSGLNLSGAVLRAARLNRTKLINAKLDRAILDQAWLLEADLSRASLKGASIFAAQMQGANGALWVIIAHRNGSSNPSRARVRRAISIIREWIEDARREMGCADQEARTARGVAQPASWPTTAGSGNVELPCFMDDFEACIAHLRFPVTHRRAIQTTNFA
jgi:hypothetical protein